MFGKRFLFSKFLNERNFENVVEKDYNHKSHNIFKHIGHDMPSIIIKSPAIIHDQAIAPVQSLEEIMEKIILGSSHFSTVMQNTAQSIPQQLHINHSVQPPIISLPIFLNMPDMDWNDQTNNFTDGNNYQNSDNNIIDINNDAPISVVGSGFLSVNSSVVIPPVINPTPPISSLSPPALPLNGLIPYLDFSTGVIEEWPHDIATDPGYTHNGQVIDLFEESGGRLKSVLITTHNMTSQSVETIAVNPSEMGSNAYWTIKNAIITGDNFTKSLSSEEVSQVFKPAAGTIIRIDYDKLYELSGLSPLNDKQFHINFEKLFYDPEKDPNHASIEHDVIRGKLEYIKSNFDYNVDNDYFETIDLNNFIANVLVNDGDENGTIGQGIIAAINSVKINGEVVATFNGGNIDQYVTFEGQNITFSDTQVSNLFAEFGHSADPYIAIDYTAYYNGHSGKGTLGIVYDVDHDG